MSNLFLAHEPLEEDWVHVVGSERQDPPMNLGKSWDIEDDSGQFTMCAWVNCKVWDKTGGYRILSKRHQRWHGGWEFVAPRRWSGKISFWSAGSHHDVGETNIFDPANRRQDLEGLSENVDPDWHHVLLTYQEGALRAYLDGKFDGGCDLKVSPAPDFDLWLGNSCPELNQAQHTFHGELRHVQVFQNALTQRQINQLVQPEFISWSRRKWKLQTSVSPARWCVDLGQLHRLSEQVESREQGWGLRGKPDVYDVVNKLIKPETRRQGVSWALVQNPTGIPVKWFVSHAWLEKFPDFVAAVGSFGQLQHGDGIWICFLANPQTWPNLLLGELFGSQAFHSPFAVAMEAAQAQLVVRADISTEAQRLCVYSRLWCVFEAWMATGMLRDGEPLPMVALGKTYSEGELARMSGAIGVSGARCSSGLDQERIMACITRQPCDVDGIISRILRAEPGGKVARLKRAHGP